MENEKVFELLELIAFKVSRIETEIKDVKSEMEDMKTEMKDMRSEISDLKKIEKEIRDIQLTLENETNKNIQLIAEGHFDLCRKLDDAFKVENEKEMLMLRVNRLENELRKVKDRIATIA